jgi:hypothetical protein
MKILIAGSRGFNDYALLCKVMNYLFKDKKIDVIISGGAYGADKLGERYAREHNIAIKQYLPDWQTFGKSAGIRRNKLMCYDADMLVAFWDGESRGTKFTIEFMESLDKPYEVCYYKYQYISPKQ